MADKIIVLSHRPAYMKAVINVNFDENITPLDKRKSKEFSKYFDQIWEMLNDERVS